MTGKGPLHPDGISAGRLRFNHFGAEPGQESAAKCRPDAPGRLHHAHASQRSAAHLRYLPDRCSILRLRHPREYTGIAGAGTPVGIRGSIPRIAADLPGRKS